MQALKSMFKCEIHSLIESSYFYIFGHLIVIITNSLMKSKIFEIPAKIPVMTRKHQLFQKVKKVSALMKSFKNSKEGLLKIFEMLPLEDLVGR